MTTPSDHHDFLGVPSPSNTAAVYGYLGGGYDGTDYHDPRTSSTQSLAPSDYDEQEKRKLLLIYIHGFMGNDNSFQNFPFHVHRFLRDRLRSTHAVHTKIYPRYKTYKAIEVARDNFSRWLEPHESPETDVVLIGHSMGGLLAAEVALMPTRDRSDIRMLQHRILGTVNLDAPLLGLHPGIITSGLASLFRKKPDPPKPPQAGDLISGAAQTLGGLGQGLGSRLTMDPNFNPNYVNDVRMKERSWWQNVVHFASKHNSEGLMDAATKHITSHLEFGSCLMDYNGMKLRYEKLRRLEDYDDLENRGMPHVPPQVRFIQYYTVCHGYPKKPKPSESEDSKTIEPASPENNVVSGNDGHHSEPASPRVSSESSGSDSHSEPLTMLEPQPEADPEDDSDERQHGDLESPGVASEQFHTPGASQPSSPAPGTGEVIGGNVSHSGSPDDGASHAPDTASPTHEPMPRFTAPRRAETGRFREDLPPNAEFTVEAALQEFIDGLPPLPDEPQKPDELKSYDASNKDIRKYVEKEMKRRNKDYEKQMKSWRAAETQRNKAIHKMRAKLQAGQKEAKDKQGALADAAASVGAENQHNPQAEEHPDTSEQGAGTTTGHDTPVEAASNLGNNNEHSPSHVHFDELRPASPSNDAGRDSLTIQRRSQEGTKKPEKPEKPPKDRKFCTCPSKVNGQMDPKWIRVFMKDVDEVAAHTGIFFAGPHYEKLVGDVGELICEWVEADATKRLVLDMENN
ncbi:hypothetical protein PFICI_08198 [Pestalotiopsis fici W106-1]|uniref:DUF676 domain-containing protein n=1 Tax=Pestalotiopsis fici (strain W106-1 / CGMCC3.15140) TaxID=1229662 RepID=W3X3T5_PESFW|nr:uncharacterized protein PFICI_08198 [Pestalotiopsis fici W106-1]ETS80669.1 hypothetical protein PFICI_08198 [Pestalotiopsis fici W106-1]